MTTSASPSSASPSSASPSSPAPLPNPRDPIVLTQALVREPSVTPHAEGAIALVAKLLEEAGYGVKLLTFESAGVPIPNLYARIGSGAPNLCFAGHLDVVPVGEAETWSHGPFSGELVGDFLYGRGAVDMKGAVAASISAALRHGAPAQGSISFLITGDEEGPALDGTTKVVEWLKQQGEHIDHCILGEPTNPAALGDALKVGRRGSLSGTLTVKGKQGHVAYPHLADNPVPRLVRLLEALQAAPLDEGSAFFPPSNLEVVALQAGTGATNVIPAEASAIFNVRFNDRFTLETLKAEIARRLDTAGAPYDLAFMAGASESFLTDPGPFVDLVKAAVAEVTGRMPESSTSGGTSDARFIKDLCPVVEFGLVGRTMHQVDEVTPISDLVALTAIYERVLAHYFATFA